MIVTDKMARVSHFQNSTTLFPQRPVNKSLKSLHSVCNTGPTSSNRHVARNLNGPLKKSSTCYKRQRGGHPDFSDNEFSAPNTFMSYKEYKEVTSSLKCYLCSRIVKVDHLSEHLLFGAVKCEKCHIVFKNCQQYQLWIVERNMGSVTCEHVLKYLGNPLEKLKSCMALDGYNSGSVVTELELKRLVKKYMIGIKSLKNSLPWQKVIALFLEYEESEGSHKTVENVRKNGNLLKSPFQSNFCDSEFNGSLKILSDKDFEDDSHRKFLKVDTADTLNVKVHSKVDDIGLSKSNDYPNGEISQTSFKVSAKKHVTSGPVTKIKTISDSANKRRANISKPRKATDCIETPSNGFYYVVRHTITECPNCYTQLNPIDYSINIVTFLMTAICSGCSLTIYIVQDPPDQDAPRVCIITDQKSIIRKSSQSGRPKVLKPKSLPEQ